MNDNRTNQKKLLISHSTKQQDQLAERADSGRLYLTKEEEKIIVSQYEDRNQEYYQNNATEDDQRNFN